MKKILVAYSGGLDTSVILKWLKNKYDAEIIAYCADVGQEEELDGLEEKALNTGATKCIVDDLREDFAKNYIFPMFQGSAIYEGEYFLGTSIARPCIAAGMCHHAKKEGVDTIVHGATGKGNDQVRFELSIASLMPHLKVIAPWRTEEFRKTFPGRKEMIEFAQKENIPVEVNLKKSYSMDRNLLHISYESGFLEDIWYDASSEENKSMYKLTSSPEDAPDQPQYLHLLFESGNCIGLNTNKENQVFEKIKKTASKNKQVNDINYSLLKPLDIMLVLNNLAKIHGIGRADIVENRYVGMKSRGVYETPGGTILYHAHRQIESITLDREVMHLRDSLIPEYAKLIYNGYWFSPERNAIQALITDTQKNVNGEVRLKLYKGNTISAGRRSNDSLYNEDIATMEGEESLYNQDDATGFININALRLKLQNNR